LALMALTREIGLVMAVAIFFLVPAIKYTEGNLKLRALFTVLCFLPFHIYFGIYDIVFYGTFEISSEILTLVLSNLAVFFIVSQLKNQNKFSSLIMPVSNFKYVVPLVIPIIFIVSNIMSFAGLYPAISLPGKIGESYSLVTEILTAQNDRHQGAMDLLRGIPRIDVLFISVALGSTFIFFKLVGFGRIIYSLKNNNQYSLVLVLSIFLLVTWALILQSGFQTSTIRHAAHFVPILSIVLVIGMRIGRDSSYWRIYSYSIIIFSTYYFLSYNLTFLVHNGNFSGFWIDPFRSSILSTIDFCIGLVLVVPLIIISLKQFKKIADTKKKKGLQRVANTLIIIPLTLLLVTQIYVVYSYGVNVSPLETIDKVPPPGWETNVVEVIDYLKTAENGNVLAVRAPAIPFFTNRTSIDMYNHLAFAYNISDLLSSKNISLFKGRLSEMGIRYIVIPNERSSLYYSVQNIMKTYPLLQVIDTDPHFEKVTFKNYDVYKYVPVQTDRIDLIDRNHLWQSFGQAEITQNENNLTIHVDTDEKNRSYNRGFLRTELNLTKPLVLSVDYKIETNVGNATYAVEIRDSDSRNILFHGLLDNLSANLTEKTFILPTNVSAGRPLEFRIYVITDGTGFHTILVDKFVLLQR